MLQVRRIIVIQRILVTTVVFLLLQLLRLVGIHGGLLQFVHNIA
jgi:hypothetical protein